MALSHKTIGILSLIVAILSIPTIGAGIWLKSKLATICIHISRVSLIPLLGGFILVVSLILCIAGFIMSRKKSSSAPLAVCFFVMVLPIIGVLLLVFYMPTVTGSGTVVPHRAYLDYHLDGFSGRLRGSVIDKWDSFKSCVSSSNECAQLNQTYSTALDFFAAHLTPFQSGCCKPPSLCEFQFVGPTNWIAAINPGVDADCATWNNDQTQLCYSCNSCKAGLLASVGKEGKYPITVLFFVSAALMIVYVLAFCAFLKGKGFKTEDKPSK